MESTTEWLRRLVENKPEQNPQLAGTGLGGTRAQPQSTNGLGRLRSWRDQLLASNGTGALIEPQTQRAIGQSMLADIPAGLLGVGSLLSGEGTDTAANTVRYWQDKLAYTPTNQRSLDQLGTISRGVEAVTDALSKAPGAGLAQQGWEAFTNASPATAAILLGAANVENPLKGGAKVASAAGRVATDFGQAAYNLLEGTALPAEYAANRNVAKLHEQYQNLLTVSDDYRSNGRSAKIDDKLNTIHGQLETLLGSAPTTADPTKGAVAAGGGLLGQGISAFSKSPILRSMSGKADDTGIKDATRKFLNGYGINHPEFEKIVAKIEKDLPDWGDASDDAWVSALKDHPDFNFAKTEMIADKFSQKGKTGVANLYRGLRDIGANVTIDESKSLGSKSTYLYAESGGKRIKIRLSDHEAKASSIDSNGSNDIDTGMRAWKTALEKSKNLLGISSKADGAK
jgi:hypothetical protein